MTFGNLDQPRGVCRIAAERSGPSFGIRRLFGKQPVEIQSLTGIRCRHRSKEGLGIRMNRVAKQHRAVGDFDDAPGAHYGDPVGDIVDDRKIMRDEKVSKSQFLLQIHQQIEDLRLDRNVERRSWFVADNKARPQCKSPGDADALALTPGKAVRIALNVPQVEPDERDELVHHLTTRAFIADAVDNQRLFDYVEDRHAWIQRPERILKNKLHLPTKFLQILALEREDVDHAPMVVEGNRAGIRIDGAQQHFAECRLPAPALADEPKALATLDLEADPVDRDDARARFGAAEQPAFADCVTLSDICTFEQRSDCVGRPFPPFRHQMRRISGWYLPYGDQALAGLHVKARDRLQQRFQIGVFRTTEDVVEGPALHHLAAIHDDNLFGHVGDDTEIVGDQQHGHIEFVLQVDHQPQDLRLNRHVESGRRLIRDEQRRTADQRHRDHCPLAQSAGQLKRVAARSPPRIGKSDEAQHLPSELGCLRGGHRPVES